MERIATAGGVEVVRAIVEAIHENAAYLSEVDGETGDGDHGVNMNKGFLMAGERLTDDMDLAAALKVVSRTLVMDIGGSMGPIYGTLFKRLAKALAGEEVGAVELSAALNSAVEGLKGLAGAEEGDKTLVDTIAPATRAFDAAVAAGKPLAECLDAMADGADAGRDATRDMVAKLGRASRLGERSRGHLDAGATSCAIILRALAEGLKARIVSE